MHTERPTALRNVDDACHELRNGALEEREFVEDEKQVRRRAVGVHLLEFDDVLRAVLGEDVLTSPQFRIERHERTDCQLTVEIRDEPDRVGQVNAVLEGSTALVVNENKVEACRRVVSCERHNQALEELALAGPRGPGHETVRPMDPQIERHGACGTESHRCVQPC